MTAPFSVRRQELEAGRAIVAVRGEIDLFTASEMNAAIREALRPGTRDLVLDLSDTTFMDSSGLAVLVRTHKAIRDRQGRLVLVNTNSVIAQTLAITGLDSILTVVDDREAALTFLAAPASSSR